MWGTLTLEVYLCLTRSVFPSVCWLCCWICSWCTCRSSSVISFIFLEMSMILLSNSLIAFSTLSRSSQVPGLLTVLVVVGVALPVMTAGAEFGAGGVWLGPASPWPGVPMHLALVCDTVVPDSAWPVTPLDPALTRDVVLSASWFEDPALICDAVVTASSCPESPLGLALLWDVVAPASPHTGLFELFLCPTWERNSNGPIS